MTDADATPPEVVVIGGREFAVGDLVLVECCDFVHYWTAGVIYNFNLRAKVFPIYVRMRCGNVHPVRVSEVHSFRENFA